MKHLVVSGADGFIGKSFLSQLNTDKIQTHLFYGEITNPADVQKFLGTLKQVDSTFHFAAISSPIHCLQNKDLAKKVNVEGAYSFAQAIAEKFPDSSFIFPSTGQVYAAGDILDESSHLNPVNFYAETKLEAEILLSKLRLNLTILRLFNHTHKSQGSQFFLPSIHQQILKGSKKIVTGNLQIIRDVGAVRDLIKALNAVLNKNLQGGVYNLCSGIGKNLGTLANELARQMDQSVEWVLDPKLLRPGEPNSIIGNSDKFQSTFGWKPEESINEVKLVESFLSDL
jgi:nucleoside-diphosphate-sugar epimerase